MPVDARSVVYMLGMCARSHPVVPIVRHQISDDDLDGVTPVLYQDQPLRDFLVKSALLQL